MLQTLRKVKLHFSVVSVTTSGYLGISLVFPVRVKNIFIFLNFCYHSGGVNLDLNETLLFEVRYLSCSAPSVSYSSTHHNKWDGLNWNLSPLFSAVFLLCIIQICTGNHSRNFNLWELLNCAICCHLMSSFKNISQSRFCCYSYQMPRHQLPVCCLQVDFWFSIQNPLWFPSYNTSIPVMCYTYTSLTKTVLVNQKVLLNRTKDPGCDICLIVVEKVQWERCWSSANIYCTVSLLVHASSLKWIIFPFLPYTFAFQDCFDSNCECVGKKPENLCPIHANCVFLFFLSVLQALKILHLKFQAGQTRSGF